MKAEGLGISVIVPVYNAENVIRRCVDSIEAQTYGNWELILVDDGSSDGSGEICDAYSKRNGRIKVIHQENRGPSVARNKGLVAANGEYVCFVDADDYVSQNYLADFHVEEDAELSVQGMNLVYSNGKEAETYKPAKTLFCPLEKALEDKSIYALLLGPCCKAFKTSIIKDAGISFPTNVHYGEDRIFVLKYLQYCSGKVLLSSVANYTYTHENNLSLTAKRKKSVELMQSSLLQYNELMNLLRVHSVFDYLHYYRRELLLDTYQAVYNNILENKLNVGNDILFARQLNPKLLGFINQEQSIPHTFRVLKVLVSLSRIGI